MSDTRFADAMAQRPSAKELWSWVARGDVALAVGIVGIVVLLILPIPAFLLDLFLSLSITSAVLILMTAILIKKPLEFTAFPTVLLVTTLFRLGLNLASTRLILSHGHEGAHAAGHVIESFGRLMMGGQFIIGLIVFAILVIVNFVVITKGSTRIAEVAARFTLDSMPGKQMAIDADLSAGLIEQDEAKKRRKELEQESTFFGAMDGASKFVRGDAIAVLIITAINVCGGILIGVIQHKLPFGQAATQYTLMTVGDGLVSQVPALIISIAAGFLVSKSGVEGSADKALVTQLATNPVSLGVVSAASGLMAFVPGMPIIPFAGISIGAGVLAWRLSHKKPEVIATETEATPTTQEEEPITTALAIDDIKIELGYGLLSLINDLEGRRLTDQIRALRRTLAAEFGFVMPPVRILDNMRLPTQGYAIRIKEMDAPGQPPGHGPARRPDRVAWRTCARAGVRPPRHLDR
jgi:flagellar biosynthesis protein FlhA